MGKPLRALFVEDSEDDTLLLVRHLKRRGYDCRYLQVCDADDLARALDQGPWDVVISDYAMPKFSAFAALEMIKTKKLDLPFIIVSGAISEETAVSAMKAGAHDYVMKNNLERLAPALERELREADIRKDRERTLAALRKSEERYRLLVENISLGVILIDRDFDILMTNSVQRKLICRSSREFCGKKCYELLEGRPGPCPDCPGVQAMISGKPAESLKDWERPDGANVSLRVLACPIFETPGNVSGFICIVEDITERKRLEDQLQKAAQMEAVGRLAGGVAHDFNNLLTAILGYSNLLLKDLDDADQNREKAVQIFKAAERAAELTRQLLAFSRKQVLNTKLLDLNGVIRNFEKILGRLLGETFELVTELSADLSAVKADRTQIEQVLLNLIVNARDAMPQGGKLLLETKNVLLDNAYRILHPEVKAGRYAMFAVTDNGTGMDAETAYQIFEPFFTTKVRDKGTGLGLSTVYGIVRQHHGHISVESRLDHGSTFKIYFPACEGESEHIDWDCKESKWSLGDETVLVVEDEESVRKLTSEALRLVGYKALEAEGPESAVEIVSKWEAPIDLLVTDIVLPRLDGSALHRKLLVANPGMKVLYMSGYPVHLFVERGLLDDGLPFLQKPFTLDTFLQRVRDILDSPSQE